MKLAPLQLVDYFVHSIQVQARSEYDTSKPADLEPDALLVTEHCFRPDEKKPRHFAVDLVIKQEALEGKNLPYTYELHIVGFVEVHPNFPEDKIRRALEINGPSMLFGAAREILRAATGRGPYGPVLIPSTTFFTLGKESTPPPPTGKRAARKRTSRRKSP